MCGACEMKIKHRKPLTKFTTVLVLVTIDFRAMILVLTGTSTTLAIPTPISSYSICRGYE